MFRAISIAALVVTFGAMVLHYLAVVLRRPGVHDRLYDVRRLTLWERLVLLGMFVGVGVLAATSFLPRLASDALMSGYVLMIHVTFGGVFAACLAASAVTWAWDTRFVRRDLDWVRGGGCLRAARELPAGRFDAAQKAMFWVLLALGVVSGLTMAASMVPLLGQAGQHLMFDVHRYVGLVLLAVALWLAYWSLIARPGAWKGVVGGKVGRQWARRYHPDWFTPADKQA